MNFSLKFRVFCRRFNCALNFAPVQPQCKCSTPVHLFNTSASVQHQCICLKLASLLNVWPQAPNGSALAPYGSALAILLGLVLLVQAQPCADLFNPIDCL